MTSTGGQPTFTMLQPMSAVRLQFRTNTKQPSATNGMNLLPCCFPRRVGGNPTLMRTTMNKNSPLLLAHRATAHTEQPVMRGHFTLRFANERQHVFRDGGFKHRRMVDSQ